MKAHREGLSLVILIAFLVCILLPSYFVASSPDDFGHLDASWLRYLAGVLFLLAGVALLAIYALIVRFAGRRIALVVLAVGLAWACTAGFAFPISRSVEMVAPILTPIAVVPLLIALAITAGMGWLAWTGRWLILAVYLGVQMTFAIVPAIPGIWTAFFPPQANQAAEFVRLSPDRNLLVVSFDDLSGILSREVLESDPALRKAFADFVLFDEAVGNAAGTELSIAHELFGARDFAAMSSTTEGLKAALPNDTLMLNDPETDAMGYASYAVFADDERRKVEVGGLSSGLDPMTAVQGVEDLYDYVWLRLGTRYTLSILDKLAYRGLDPIEHFFDFVGANCRSCDDLSRKLVNHKGAVWDRHSLNSLRDRDPS